MTNFPHYSLIAFKALVRGTNGILYSAVQYSAWKKLQMGWHYLSAHRGDLDDGTGVYATDYATARSYLFVPGLPSVEEFEKDGGELWVCVPDPGGRVVEAAKGWRADAAFAVVRIENKDNLVEIAHLVKWAETAGYKQVEEVRNWAFMVRWGVYSLTRRGLRENLAGARDYLLSNADFLEEIADYPQIARRFIREDEAYWDALYRIVVS